MDEQKRNLRNIISQIMDKTNDAGFAKWTLYKQGYDVDEIENELGVFGGMKAEAMANAGQDWGTIANNLQSSKFDTSTGGFLDMQLNKKFNPENYQRMATEAALTPAQKIQMTQGTPAQSEKQLEIQQEQEKAKNNALNALSKVSLLENHPALKTSVGVKGLTGGILGGWVMPGTKSADFNAQLDALKSMLTIENLGIMKGVLSDADIKILREAATSISKDMSEADFKAELARIKTVLEGKAGVTEGDIFGKENQPTQGKTSSGLTYTIEY